MDKITIEELHEKTFKLIDELKDFIISNQNNKSLDMFHQINHNNDLMILSKDVFALNNRLANFDIENTELSSSEKIYAKRELSILKRFLNYEFFKVWYLPKSITLINNNTKLKQTILIKIREFINVVNNDNYNLKQSNEMHDFLLQFKKTLENNNI
jgi:hypothetical protein